MTLIGTTEIGRPHQNRQPLRTSAIAVIVIGATTLVGFNAKSFGSLSQQPETEPPATETATQPAGQPDTVDDLMRSIRAEEDETAANESGAGEETPATPTSPSAAEVVGQALPPLSDSARPPIGRLLPEGARLVRRRGWLARDTETGVWVIAFTDPDERGRTLTPMILMPSRRLEFAEGLFGAGAADTATAVEISGQIYVFDDRNYIMPTHIRHLTGDEAAAVSSGESSIDTGAESATDRDPGAGEPADVTVDSLIGSLKSGDGVDEGDAASAPRIPAASRTTIAGEQLLPEGSFIISRRGRITRSRSSGEWIFRFDSDTNGKIDPPVVLLPCQMLNLAISIAHTDGDGASLLLSGPVYVYHERNYVIPTVIQRPYPNDNLSPAD